jgi:hypothetical protein
MKGLPVDWFGPASQDTAHFLTVFYSTIKFFLVDFLRLS